MSLQSPEIWAGVECSVVRIGDRIVDELSLTGHARRPGDLRRLADLGVRTIRYPALWERHANAARGHFEWAATDQRLGTMRVAALRPVLGLFHQGTGRRGELLNDGFPDAFGSYAAAVASRYPWVDAYAPINEAMTTARFAGLYGHWYPHAHDDRVFAKLVVAQVQAFRAAARAIRAVRSDATIISTEDVGETFATPELAGQAAFDRQRRWLVLDMLTGRFDRHHPLRPWLTWVGVAPATLDALEDVPDAERPNLLGIHHYPTSDRYLDHRLDRYPASSHGGNGTQAYADVEALRVIETPLDGLRTAVRAAAARYGLPVALTEVHLGGGADQQRAWWWGAIRAADDLIASGVPLRAVTAWSAFGSWEWSSLLTETRGHYEPGLFDTRERPPRATPLAIDVAAAAAGERREPEVAGWWDLPDRVLYPAVDANGRDVLVEAPAAAAAALAPSGRARADRRRLATPARPPA